jgi:hypothetical protein
MVTTSLATTASMWRALPLRPSRTRSSVRRVARHRSLTSHLYRAARASNNLRAAGRGPGAYAKRQVRRKAYRASGGFMRSFLRALGLSK